MRTRQEKCEYSKGYAAAARRAWPSHKPPLPPDEILKPIIETALAMRSEIDHQLAVTFESDDPLALAIYEKIDAFDDAMSHLSAWLKEKDPVV
jgi:hypothetical protein